MTQTVIHNRKALHDYFILEKFEAGIVLKGAEVKSIREGRANIKDSFAKIIKNEVFLFNMHISPYSHGNIYNPDPLRERKLLLKRKEINRLMGLMTKKGFTLIPLSVYFKNGKVKVELALAKGKKQYDKREEIKKRDLQREEKKYKINM